MRDIAESKLGGEAVDNGWMNGPAGLSTNHAPAGGLSLHMVIVAQLVEVNNFFMESPVFHMYYNSHYTSFLKKEQQA